MTYVLCFHDQPIFMSQNWLELSNYALNGGWAVNARGCLFTLCTGVTIQRKA